MRRWRNSARSACPAGFAASGLRLLAYLLSRPGKEILSTELAATLQNDATRSNRKLGGDSDGERARINVSRSIARALKKITGEHPVLGEHLTRSVRTGTFCVYAPDPLVPIVWNVDAG